MVVDKVVDIEKETYENVRARARESQRERESKNII